MHKLLKNIRVIQGIQGIIKIDAVVVNAIIIAVVNALGIMYIKKINPNKDADRYYHYKEPAKYLVFNMAYTVLLLSMAINCKYVLAHCVGNVFTWAKKKVLG